MSRPFLLACGTWFVVQLVSAPVSAQVLPGVADTREQTPPPATSPEGGVANLSLDALRNLRIQIASVTAKPVREQPAIVTLVTEREIAAMGATDLMDVLASVPGFAFASDVGGVVGTGLRGLWAYEGKILLLVDGVPANEGLYGNVLARHHYPADQIRTVEIIRGPGAAVYGGSAELAVIRVRTKGAEQDGGFVSFRPEATAAGAGAAFSTGLGYSLGDDWRVSGAFSYQQVIGLDQTWHSLTGERVQTGDRSLANPAWVNVAVGWRNLNVRVIHDDYRFENGVGAGLPGLSADPLDVSWRTSTVSASYHLRPSPRWQLAPHVTFASGLPWRTEIAGGPSIFEVSYRRVAADLPAFVRLDSRQYLRVGLESYVEGARAIGTNQDYGFAPADEYFSGSDRVSYNDVAGYAQYELNAGRVGVTAGGRYERHSYAGQQFVPRLGVTWADETYHVKLLYDRAFRTPNIGNIHRCLRSDSIVHETTSAYQLEFGAQPTAQLSWTGNLFFQQVDRPIAFTSSGDLVADVRSTALLNQGYLNGSPVSSYGGEFEVRYAGGPFSGRLSYAYYRAGRQLSGSDGLYGSSISGVNLALPSHSASFLGSWRLNERLDWHVSGTTVGRRRGFDFPGTEQWFSPELDLTTTVEYRAGQVTLRGSLHNLLDTDVRVVQAYNGAGSPLPMLGRHASLTLAYRF